MKKWLKTAKELSDKWLHNIEKETMALHRDYAPLIKKIFKKHYLRARKFAKKVGIKNLIIGALSLFLIIFGGFLLWFTLIEIPDLASFENRKLNESTKIYDKTGNVLLYDLSQDVRRTTVPLASISPNIINATLAIEDADFYKHNGIKPTAIFRALLANIFELELSQGGSTITQQLVKNSLLTTEKNISRKIKEAILAIKLERVVSKEEIIERYLNEMPYGGTIYGVEEATQTFYGKAAKDVSLSEGAYIAAVLKGPTYYSPYGKHREELEQRKNLVLSEMKRNGFITAEEFEVAKAERYDFKEKFASGIKAPHFVMFIREYLEENYGEKMISGGGLKVITTLDYEMQKTAEEIVNEYALENAKKYNATNAGLVAIDSGTGQILTMVGSRDYFDEEIQGNYNIAVAKRQPGSSFKPFVYAAAFEKGYRPETILFDTKTQFSTNCQPNDFKDTDGCYSPENYDGRFRGPLTLRNALAQSINIPAVKLLYLVGIQDAINLARKMGISTLTDPARYGLTLVLGGGEVTLLDMTSAYSVFSNGGEKRPTTGILKIEDKKGNILEEWEDMPTRVLNEETTLLISDVLTDNTARTPVFGARSSLYFPTRDVAAKTGTTNNYRDTWVVGYTPAITVGAWAGNNDNSPIDRRVAGYIVAPMWHAVMEEILKNMPDEKFEEPPLRDLSTLKPILRGVWDNRKEDGSENIHSILYFVNRSDPLGDAPRNPGADSQFTHWEYGVRLWALGSGLVYDPNVIPPATETGSTSNPNIEVEFRSIRNREQLSSDEKNTVSLRTTSVEKIVKADYFINGSYVGNALLEPFKISFIPKDIKGIGEDNILRVVVTDAKGNQKDNSIEFRVK